MEDYLRLVKKLFFFVVFCGVNEQSKPLTPLCRVTRSLYCALVTLRMLILDSFNEISPKFNESFFEASF